MDKTGCVWQEKTIYFFYSFQAAKIDLFYSLILLCNNLDSYFSIYYINAVSFEK